MSRVLRFGSAGIIVVTLVAGLTGCGLRDGAEAPPATSESVQGTSDAAEDQPTEESEPTEPAAESPGTDPADTAELEQLLDEAEGIMTGVEQEMADDATS